MVNREPHKIGDTPQFITMLYLENDILKKFSCDFPAEFINEFENNKNIVIGFFFIMGQHS